MLPDVRLCYAVSSSSSPAVISILREHHIPMICHNSRQLSLVGDESLVIAGRRFHSSLQESIVRSVHEIKDGPAPAPTPTPLLWVYSAISNDGVAVSKEMFEYIWARKYILNGIVFNVNNFSNRVSAIPPTMYSYKIGLDYVFRNIIVPFEKEYAIQTPAVMIDGRYHITQMSQVDELSSILSERKMSSSQRCPDLHLILGQIIDHPL
jgi:hypothetical protein